MAKTWQEVLESYQGMEEDKAEAAQIRKSAIASGTWPGSKASNVFGTLNAPGAYDIAPLSFQIYDRMTVKPQQEDRLFQSGLFADGWQFGDLAKAILGTGVDTAEDLTIGAVSGAEQAVDALALVAPMMEQASRFEDGGVHYTLKQLEEQEKKLNDSIARQQEFVKKDIMDEQAAAKILLGSAVKTLTFGEKTLDDIAYEENSVLGSKGDALVQSGGSMLARKAVASFVPGADTALLALSSMGGEAENALLSGATYEEAMGSGAISAAAEVFSEMISDGIKLDGTALPDVVTKQIGRVVTNKVVRNLAAIGVDMFGEGAEELLSGTLSAIGQKLTYAKDKELRELFTKEDRMDSFVGGMIMGMFGGSVNAVQASRAGVDYASRLSANEKKVVDQLYNEGVEEAQKNGGKVNKAKIYDDIVSGMDRGEIAIDDIERILGGESYKTYKDTVASEDATLKQYKDLTGEYKVLNDMDIEQMSDEQLARQNELRKQIKGMQEQVDNIKTNSQRESMRTKLSEDVFGLVKGSRLTESYNEKAKRSQTFKADLTQYDEKQRGTIQKAIDSGLLNNTRKTHEFVDLVAKISADKGVSFDFTNNKKLRETGFAIDGKEVNGFVTKDGVTLNMDSRKALNSTVGHEITHVLEGTELYTEMQKAVFSYAESKGELGSRWSNLKELYKGIDGADVNAELTADLVGDYLFSDDGFIRNLSTGNRNVFQKVYDEIKYLCKVATAGSKEARELERIKHLFEKAYRAEGKSQTETKYSMSEDGHPVTKDMDGEVTYSLSNDADYMDKAISQNEAMKRVDSDVMTAAKDIRKRIADRMSTIKDKGLVGLPEDIEGNTYIANSSYDGTEENTTICPRSLASEAFVDAVSEYLGRPLTVEEQIYISQDLQGRSLTPECTYCYVATDRKAYRAFLGEYVKQRDSVLQKLKADTSADVSRGGELYKEFRNGRKDTDPMYNRFKMWVEAYQKGKPMIDASHLANISKLMGDINSEFGAELKPQIVDAMKYAQSASWAKKRVNYVAYNGHILKWKQDRINKLNSHYGLRMYSFSDFHPAFVLENMQMITDASVRGLKMLGYTKDTDFVEIFAPSGMNINISTFGFETGGNVFENNIIGAEWQKAQELRQQYPNVGITFVATNDNLVEWGLQQDWIDVVIPFHLVRTGKEVAKAFKYHDYTSESSDVKTKDWKKGDKKYIAPTDHNNDKDTYLAELEKNHLKPRFERFVNDPNYMKLVNECRQPASESKPVQPVFNEDAAMTTLSKLETNGYYQPIGGSVDRMYEIAGEVAEAMEKEIAPTQYSLSEGTEAFQEYGNYNVYGSDIGIAPTPLKTDLSDYAVGLIRFATDGELTWGKVRQIIDRPEYREAFEEVTGITLEGSRSEQKRIVMGAAEELRRYEDTVQMEEVLPIGDVDRIRPPKPKVSMTIQDDERFQPLLEVMTDGKMTFAGAKTIANSAALRHAFESLYGITLPKTNTKAVPHILSLAEDVESMADAYESTQNIAPVALKAEIDAPIAETAAPAAEKADVAPKAENGSQPAEKGSRQSKADPVTATTRKELHMNLVDRVRSAFGAKGLDFDKVLKNAKNLRTWATVDNTPQRVMEKALGYKAGQILADMTVNKAAQNETEGIKWLNGTVDMLKSISKQYGIKPGSKESAAAQMYAEGFYVNDNNEIVAYGDRELAIDFPNAKVRENIKGLARDPRIRQFYDDTLKAINESRRRNLYPEIQKLDNYFLHFRAMDDTFSRLGLPFNPNDIRAKDLPTDLNGVTADLKPGQPYFASAMHRKGKRTSFDLLGGLERYANSAKNQIYHIDDIQILRALRNHVADTYGQAHGLEGLDDLTEIEQQERIQEVFGSHLSTFAKFLNEEANVLAGKTALIDRGAEGMFGRRAMTFLNTLNGQVGSNMVGYNISSSLTNFLPVAQTFAKTNKFDFTKAFVQTAINKLPGVKLDTFTEDSPVVIRRKGSERFHKTWWQQMADPGYALMSAVDDISTEIIARTKFNEFTRKGMDAQKAHIETDKWVSRLMGDRSIGQMPQLYNSKTLGLFTKFQLEVRNQLDSQFYDTIQETKVSNEHMENELARNAKTAAQITSTLVQLAVAQHLYGKAFESVAGYNPAFDIIEVLMTAFGYDDEEESEDTALDNLGQGLLALGEDLPYVSTITGGGRIPMSSALPNVGAILAGEDEYGNEIGVPKAFWENVKEIAPYYAFPGGWGQAKKTAAGLKMYDLSEDHPIAGSYTASGNLRFPVDDEPLDVAQAAIFGQYASENARKYFDEERKTLNKDQTKIFAELGMPIEDYWEYQDNYNQFKDLRNELYKAASAEGATAEDVVRNEFADSIYYELNDLYKQQKELADSDSLLKQSQMRDIQQKMSDLLERSKMVDRVKVDGIYAEVGDRRYNYSEEKDTWYEIKQKNSDGDDNWYYTQEQLFHDNMGISYADYWNENFDPAVDPIKSYYAEMNGKRYNYDAEKNQWYEIREKNEDGSDNWYYQMEQEAIRKFGISNEEYWSKRDEYNFGISHPQEYALAGAVGGYDKYKEYYDALESWNSDSYIGADKDEYGNSISGSRKKKVKEYVYGLDLPEVEKHILFKSVYTSDDTHNKEIVTYLNNRRDLSYKEKELILVKLGAKVDSKGKIKW